MEMLSVLWIVWGILTAALVVLLIYRSTLSIHEDDQLFLDDAESHMQNEQIELQKRMGQIRPLVNLLGAASGALILVIGAMWVWRGWNM
jgi:beta-lactamase regulating signal transducer with metallopeptidase domain